MTTYSVMNKLECKFTGYVLEQTLQLIVILDTALFSTATLAGRR